MPSHGQSLELALRAGAPGAGYVLYGPPSAPITVERGDLLGEELSLTVQESEPRVYALRPGDVNTSSGSGGTAPG